MKRYYASLDLLRIIAAFSVAFFFHYLIVFGKSPFTGNVIGDFLNTNGGYVVELFFFISGFVVYEAYNNRIRDKQLSFGKYIVDRIIRLYPLLIITVIFAWIPMWIGYGLWSESICNDSKVYPLAILLNLFGLNGGTVMESSVDSVNGPSWFITTLMICYILYFAVVNLCKKSKAAENICFLAIVLIGLFIYMNPISVPFLFVSNARGYIFFFIGTFVSQLQKNTKVWENILLCIASVGLVVMFVFAKHYNILMNDSLEAGLFVVVPVALFAINFVPLNWMCNNKGVKFLGAISFGIFLWNLPVFIWVKFINRLASFDFDYENIIVYLIIVCVNIAIAVLTYFIVEVLLVNKIKEKKKKNENENNK